MAGTHFGLAVNITHKMVENTLETTNMSLTRPGDLVLSSPVRHFLLLLILDLFGPYWTILDQFGPFCLFGPVYLNLSIWTCLFDTFY